MLEPDPIGGAPTGAVDLLAEARALLSRDAVDGPAILGLARAALSHIRASHLFAVDPGTEFLAARHADVDEFLDRLGAQPAVSRLSLGTLLASLEFLVKAERLHAEAWATT